MEEDDTEWKHVKLAAVQKGKNACMVYSTKNWVKEEEKNNKKSQFCNYAVALLPNLIKQKEQTFFKQRGENDILRDFRRSASVFFVSLR